MALLSISLGVLNFPIPVYFGQLTMLVIEAIRGEPLPARVENFVYSWSVNGRISLVFAVTNDILGWVG